MTSGLKPGLHIEEFISGGPKNNAYRTVNPATDERETVYGPRNNAELQRFQTFKFRSHMGYTVRERVRNAYGAQRKN
jgi:hypothetical protein